MTGAMRTNPMMDPRMGIIPMIAIIVSITIQITIKTISAMM